MANLLTPNTVFEFSMASGSHTSEFKHLYLEFTERQRTGEYDAYYSRSFMPDWMRNCHVSGQYDNESGMIYAVRLQCEFKGANGTKEYARLCKVFAKVREETHRGLTFGQLAYYFGKALQIEEIVLKNTEWFSLRHGAYLIDDTIKNCIPDIKTLEIEFG